MTKLIQHTLYAHPKFGVQTNHNVVQWAQYLKNERARFIKHGRRAEIRKNERGELALFVDEVKY